MGQRDFAIIYTDVGTCGSWILSVSFALCVLFFFTSSLFHHNHAWSFMGFLYHQDVLTSLKRFISAYSNMEKKINYFLKMIIFLLLI